MGLIQAASRAKLAHALLRAYPDYLGLGQLLARRLARSLEDVVGAGTPYRETVFRLLASAEAGGWLADLVTNAAQDNPQNPGLQALAETIIRPRIGTTQDPLAALIVGGDAPFLDRQVLRSCLAELLRPDGRRALIVDGPPGSGKSYSLHLIAHLSEALGTFDVASVALEDEAYLTLRPDQIATSLAFQIGSDPSGVPAGLPAMQTSRWTRHIADWLVAQVMRNARKWWFVFDGFDHPDVPIETQEFVQFLLLEAATLRRTDLRIVLLGCREALLPLSVRPWVLWDTPAPLTEGDVKDFLQFLARERDVSVEAPEEQTLVNAVMRLGREPRQINAGLRALMQHLRSGT